MAAAFGFASPLQCSLFPELVLLGTLVGCVGVVVAGWVIWRCGTRTTLDVAERVLQESLVGAQALGGAFEVGGDASCCVFVVLVRPSTLYTYS